MSRLRRLAATALLFLSSGCVPGPAPFDYGPYRAHLPRSIAVLPPLNESNDVNAPYVYLSTITRPLAESGYYVFPVAVVDAFMKENGLPTSGEMHAVAPRKLREVIGADAVLYVTIEEWGQKYRILSSDTVVRARATLIDTASGATLWSGEAAAAQSSSSAGQSDALGMLIQAAVSQVIASFTDPTHDLARAANRGMIGNANRGLLLGPYRSDYATDLRGR